MNSIHELSVIDDILLENMTSNKEFYEFCDVMNRLDLFTNTEIYTEEVVDNTPSVRKFASTTGKNTLDTTRDVVNVYGTIVDANATVIKTTWDLVAKLVSLAAKALAFIIKKISKIPTFILRVVNRVTNLPSEVAAKIRGDITIYIQAKDIELIYNKLVINRLIEYITLSSELANGDFWSTMLNRRINIKTLDKINDYDDNSKTKIKDAANKIVDTVNKPTNAINDASIKTPLIIGTNDMKLCRKMDEVYLHIENLNFNPTIIPMNSDNINIYFGNSKIIKFTDRYGKKHECSYLEALNILIKDIESKKDELENIQNLIGDKLKKSEINQSYNKLNGHTKYRISTTISQISKVVTITGNFVKYIMTDVNTINKSIDKMLEKSNNSTSTKNNKS